MRVVGLPARHHRDRQPGADAAGRRRRARRSAPATRSRPRTTSRRRWSTTTASRSSRSRARTTRPTTATSTRRSTTGRRSRSTTAPTSSRRIHTRAHAICSPDVIGGTEETTTGVIRLRAMADDGVLAVPDHRRQRRRHQALLRQPLRHRPEHDRRHPPRHQHPARRARRSSSPATAGAARASRCARAAWARSVIVTEIDPVRALEAVMDGFRVMPMAEAAARRRHLHHRSPATSTSSTATTSTR